MAVEMDKLQRYLASQKLSLDHESLLRREVAYERIKDAIKHADLSPGEPLSETRLSTLLGISRTPVREALQQLAQEGLVEIIPGRAVTVASNSVSDVLNIVHMRLLLEPELMRLVAESAPAAAVEALEEAMCRMEQAIDDGNYTDWSRADSAYHEIVAHACPNSLLGETVLQLRIRVHHMASVDSQSNPQRLADCTVEHRAVVEAIKARNGQAAEAAMRTHLMELRESLFRRLSYR